MEKNRIIAALLLATLAVTGLNCGGNTSVNTGDTSSTQNEGTTGQTGENEDGSSTSGTTSQEGGTTQNGNTTTDGTPPPKKQTDEEIKESEPWGDLDQDGILNRVDNCISIFNPDQTDSDNDGIGDACDNCPKTPNFDQKDVCSLDSEHSSPVISYIAGDDDNDGIPNRDDNCKDTPNQDQNDRDGDGVGDACDNCPDVPNKYQVDSNGNGVGDACEPEVAGPECTSDPDCKAIANDLICVKNKCVCDTKSAQAEVLKPNILLLIDKSGSMGETSSDPRITMLKSALNSLVDETAGSVRYGVAYFGQRFKDYEVQLPVGEYTATKLKNIWANFLGDWGTPTDTALLSVVSQGTLDDPNPNRVKAVVLLTDGEPARPSETIAAARTVYNAGIEIYAVGVKFGTKGEQNLQAVARAGSGNTRSFINANDTTALANTLKKIATESISCTMELSHKPADPNQIWVYVNNSPNSLIRNDTNGFTYDAGNNTITVQGTACDQLKNTQQGATTKYDVILGCAAQCTPQPGFENGKSEDPKVAGTTEYCNYIDDNCDGVIDEGCDQCVSEICGDGIDNDCDGVVDNGCPGKKLDGEDCEQDSDCLNGHCDPDTKKCALACRPAGVYCSEPSDCCNNVCQNNQCGLG